MPADVGLWGGLACLLGQHVRSRGQAHAMPEGWVSRCARCSVPMARAHGGGKWQVVKTPKLRQPLDKASANAALVAAMSRSRQAGIRKEAKDALAAQKALASETAPVERTPLDDTPMRRKRGLFRRFESGDSSQRARRFPFFRRKPASVDPEAPVVASIDDGGAAQPGKAKRNWFSRRQRGGAEAAPGDH